MNSNVDKTPHEAIMKEEVIDNLITNKSGIYLDCTLGFGGHTERILKEINHDGIVVGLDCDPDAYSYSAQKFLNNRNRVKIFNENYACYNNVLDKLKINEVDGVLMDLGISSYQIDNYGRGFSYRYEAPLDMRFDINYRKTAYDILNTYSEKDIALIIETYGEERNFKNIAKSIVKYSKRDKMKTTYDLKASVEDATRYKGNINKTLSRVFQSIRIEVNQEFENIKKMISSLPYRVRVGGRIIFLTFHSLEDRLVKRCTFGMHGKNIDTSYGSKRVLLTSKKIVRPSRAEIVKNKRSRSAKLRGLKIAV